MKTEELILLGGLAYLVLSKTAGASNTSTTLSPGAEGSTTASLPTSPTITITPTTPTAVDANADFKSFVSHIVSNIQAAGFSAPVVSTAITSSNLPKLRSQLIDPVFDARVALQRQITSIKLSGNNVPYDMQQSLKNIMSFEKSLMVEMQNYKPGAWS